MRSGFAKLSFHHLPCGGEGKYNDGCKVFDACSKRYKLSRIKKQIAMTINRVLLM